MRSTLENRNRQLLRDAERLLGAMDHSHVLSELVPYADRVRAVCKLVRDRILRNLADLALAQDSILEDVLSNTQQATQLLRLLSSRLVTPILRSLPSDRLGLKVIMWLHSQHPRTAKYPAALADGDCAIWPFLEINPIYFFPTAEQRGLLYLPLYFHEFGHLLYACHKQEMDDLVRDLQQNIEDILTPASQRGDKHSFVQASHRQAIVSTWYKWAQEHFCDAVGLTIGGPAFLSAISAYLGTLDRGDFYRPLPELNNSGHPVTLLRIRLLVWQARRVGLSTLADSVAEEWEAIASAMGVVEDYHGYYAIELHPYLEQTLADMMTEAASPQFSPYDKGGDQLTVTSTDSPVMLVNKAWKAFSSKSEKDYADWESKAIEAWLH